MEWWRCRVKIGCWHLRLDLLELCPSDVAQFSAKLTAFPPPTVFHELHSHHRPIVVFAVNPHDVANFDDLLLFFLL